MPPAPPPPLPLLLLRLLLLLLLLALLLALLRLGTTRTGRRMVFVGRGGGAGDMTMAKRGSKRLAAATGASPTTAADSTYE